MGLLKFISMSELEHLREWYMLAEQEATANGNKLEDDILSHENHSFEHAIFALP